MRRCSGRGGRGRVDRGLGGQRQELLTQRSQYLVGLVERAILMATRPGDLVVDVFTGSCTTVVAALLHGRRAAGADLNAPYLAMGQERLRQLAAGSLPRRLCGRALAG